MIVKRLRLMFSVICALSTSLLLLPSIYNNAYASSASAAHEEQVTESAQEGEHDELPGEVPLDRPIEEIQTSLAPMNELDIFPCSDCHDEDWEADPERRELEEPHDEIPGKFVNHDSENRWCLDCHSAKQRDKFQLLNGNLVDFNEYYKVCEQCHKRVYREWKMGVHGKRTGNWNGDKEWMHCTQCHDPHNPPFQSIKPEPAPRNPLNIRASSSEEKQSTPTGTQH